MLSIHLNVSQGTNQCIQERKYHGHRVRKPSHHQITTSRESTATDTHRKQESSTALRAPWMLSEAQHIPGLPSAALSAVCLTHMQDESIGVTADRQLEDVVRREPCGQNSCPQTMWVRLQTGGPCRHRTLMAARSSGGTWGLMEESYHRLRTPWAGPTLQPQPVVTFSVPLSLSLFPKLLSNPGFIAVSFTVTHFSRTA